MASINNWLNFSLSPMDHLPPPSHHYPYTTSHPSPTTVTTNCFSFSTDSSSETPLDIDFLHGADPHNQHQDWNMRSSELSMLVGSSSCPNLKIIENSKPKLEDFLSGHSYLNVNDSSYSLQLPSAAAMVSDLSVSAESQSSAGLPLITLENKDRVDEKCSGAINQEVPKKSVETFGQRTSIYRGVTRHRWTGRYEAHLWDNSCKREGQTRKGRQVYLGGYDKEEKAARAYDLIALKYWGTTTTTNFPIGDYEKEIEEMKHMTRQEYVASIRRKSSGFSRGASIYRGVTRHHQHGRWQARIGRVAGNKDLYLGTFTTQEEAAEAYDIAAIKFRGLNAITNFEMNRYDVKSILESSTLPIGSAAKRLKEASSDSSINSSLSSQLTEEFSSYGWPATIAFQQKQPLGIHYPYNYQHSWCKQDEDCNAVAAQSLHEMNSFQQPNIYSSIDSCSTSLELCTGMNSEIYNGNIVGLVQTNQGSARSCFGDEGKHLGAGNVYGWLDSYRSAYYPLAIAKATDYEQSSDHSSALMAASAQGIAQHGAPVFTVWNESEQLERRC